MPDPSPLDPPEPKPGPPDLDELTRTFASIGFLSFGGAAGQIAMMYRVVVEEKRWISEQRFMHALNYCMLLPGPEAQQLATYIGWLMRGVRGGLIAGLLFVVPGAVVMLALSLLYVFAANVALVEGIFFGIKAAVLALILQSVLKIGARALRTRFLIGLSVVSFLAILVLDVPFPLIVIGCGLAGLLLARTRPELLGISIGEPVVERTVDEGRLRRTMQTVAAGLAIWWAPVVLAALLLGSDNILVDLGLFFSKMAVLTFGGAYALLAWLAQAAVSQGWVDPLEMADGLGLAETTPGPTILVTQFVGFLAAYRDPAPIGAFVSALLGAAMTTWVTFAPSFLWIFAGAPYVEDLRANQRLAAALRTISAAVVGVVAFLGVWFALHVLFRSVVTLQGPLGLRWFSPSLASVDGWAVLLCLGAFGLVFAARLGMLSTIGIMAALGVAVRLIA